MAHHEPFKALGRIGWEVDVDHFALEWLMERTFAAARTLVASIPVPTHLAACASGGTGRARSATDSAVGGSGPRLTASQPAGDADVVAKLTREWKEVKVGAHGSRENPLGVAVWRLPGRDGNGTWFARRSIHEGVPFETWRLGFEREFAETLGRSVVEGGELGNVRGIAAERRVENKVVRGAGKLEGELLVFSGASRDWLTQLPGGSLSTLGEVSWSDRAQGLCHFAPDVGARGCRGRRCRAAVPETADDCLQAVRAPGMPATPGLCSRTVRVGRSHTGSAPQQAREKNEVIHRPDRDEPDGRGDGNGHRVVDGDA